jgi:hypothetical protein
MLEYVEMSWRELIEELDPCRDCSNRGRMWILKCDVMCMARKRWVEIRKVAKDRSGA